MTTPEQKKELSIPQFPITYWNDDGTFRNTVYVKAMPFLGKDGSASLSDLISLQEKLLKYAAFETAAIGSLLCDPIALTLIQDMAKMLCVVGKIERGIDVNNLLDAGDFLQIGWIFLSESYTEDKIVPPDDYQPSAIARIHRMNFTGKLAAFNREATLKLQREAIAAMAPEIEEPTSTPQLVAATGKSTSSRGR